MPLLTDAPAPRELQLLRDVAEGFSANRGAWPVWQYVLLCQSAADADGETVLRGLPRWQYSYRPVWTGSTDPPALEAPVHLTIHGMLHCEHPGVQDLMLAFVACVRIANERVREVVPLPDRVQALSIDGFDLTTEANLRAGTAVLPGQLCDVLKHEVPTWSGIKGEGDSFAWDLSQARLRPYRHIASGQDYLSVLEDLVGTSRYAAAGEPLPPAALPQALDRLDLVWQLTFSKKLLNVPRASLPVALTLPVSGVEEFHSRCSALADILDGLAPKTGAERGRDVFERMNARIRDKLAPGAGRAINAVRILRSATGVRDGQQHNRAQAKYEPARRALGLTGFGDDCTGAWEQMRQRVCEALDVIADELLTHLEASREQPDR